MPADDLDIVWLDYPTLAHRLGTTHDAARQRAKRGRWARRRGNDGGWLVGVPTEALDDHKRDHDPLGDHAQGDDQRDDRGHAPAGDHDRDQVAVINAITATFTQHIDRLEQALEVAQEKATLLEKERDEARAEAARAVLLAAQVDALNGVLAVERERIADERRQAEERVAGERQRADDWKLAADRFATQAEKLAQSAETWRGWWPWRRSA